ncbi:MAG: hypothetical protein ACRCTR_09975 [Actinomycetota bacterium]
MRRILLVSAVLPSELALLPAIEKLSNAGYQISLALPRNFGPALPQVAPAQEHVLDLARPWLKGPKPARWTPAWLWVVIRNVFYQVVWRRLGRRVLALMNVTRRTWHLAHADPWFRDQALKADLIVALDRYATYTVWKAARKYNTTAPALHGLDAASREAEILSGRGVERNSQKL